MKSLNLLYSWMKKNMKYFLVSFIAVIFSTYTRTIVPLFTQHAIDSILGDYPSRLPKFIVNIIEKGNGILGQLLILAILLVTFQAIRSIGIFIRGRYNSIFSEKIAYDMRMKLYGHIQDLPYSYHTNAEKGDLIQRCTSDIDTIRNFTNNQFPELIRVIFLFTFIVVQMLILSPKMTLISLVIIPIIFIFSYTYFRKIQKVFKDLEEAEGKMTSTLQENLTGIRVVKAFARERYEIDKFEKDSSKYRNIDIKLIDSMAKYWASSDFIVLSQYAITLVAGTYFAIKGEITLGTLVVFFRYVQSVLWPIRGLGRIIADYGKTTISLSRIHEVLDVKDEYHEEHNLLKPNIEGNIEFKNVSFKFEDSKIPLLTDISFKVNKGEKIAVIGKTGSGKSTLIHLLIRLLDYNSGDILIDGIKLKDIDKKWIRKNIGLILQEPFLYSRTVLENIGITKNELDKKDVFNAAKIACIHNDIANFEKGYDTKIGERGVTLSGGQRQRVAIARMLIEDRPILIFDDSLSAVDTETDLSIRTALENRSNDTTMFIITHRVQTAMEADKIIILNEGSIDDIGNHDELLNTNALYKNLWEIQSDLKNETNSGVGE